ncbi:hypothetical protein PIB30_058603 [Stylosanthes scabra]|uniref:Uncharacterized protein n=1 Tax=Stylosanthes scabra TaxID=79078 RepID=A0ABU6WJM2_9FABA|nr:hypothetical protein [Stylosanthes scabra]
MGIASLHRTYMGGDAAAPHDCRHLIIIVRFAIALVCFGQAVNGCQATRHVYGPDYPSEAKAIMVEAHVSYLFLYLRELQYKSHDEDSCHLSTKKRSLLASISIPISLGHVLQKFYI